MEDEENESKPEAGSRHSYFLAVAFFQFLHLRGLFDPEVDLVAVVAELGGHITSGGLKPP